jgi:hypothetical protein
MLLDDTLNTAGLFALCGSEAHGSHLTSEPHRQIADDMSKMPVAWIAKQSEFKKFKGIVSLSVSGQAIDIFHGNV